MSGNTKDKAVTTIMYDPDIQYDQNPVTGQLYATIVENDDEAPSDDFPFYCIHLIQVPVSGNIDVLATASENEVTQTDQNFYPFDVIAPFNNNYVLLNQMYLTSADTSFNCDHSGTDVVPQTVNSKKSRFTKCNCCNDGNCSKYTTQKPEIESNNNNLSAEQTSITKSDYPNKKKGMATFANSYKRNGNETIFLANSNHADSKIKNNSATNSRILNKPYHCKICNGRFSHYSSLWNHKQLHTGDKPYKCGICELSFAKNAYLMNHIRVHTGEKPFKCDVCGIQFSQSSHLKNHKRIHSGERPYRCKVCDKTFARYSTLWNHKRIHTGEKPYRCDICGAGFSQTTHLKNHNKVHTGEKSRCDICGTSVSGQYSLKRHKNIHKKYAEQQRDETTLQTVTFPSQELEDGSGQNQIGECIYNLDYTIGNYDSANSIPTDIAEIEVDHQNKWERDTHQQQIEDCMYK